jgi:hypothetical protein
MPLIPSLRRLRQEDGKFKASLGCLKTNKQKRKWKNELRDNCFQCVYPEYTKVPRT